MPDLADKRKRISITVADNRFTVLSSEDESYSRELASEVDKSIREMCASGRISVTAAAILTAVNSRDEIHKLEKDIEQLKKQLCAYLEEIVMKGAENARLRKETDRLKNDLAVCRRRLMKESPTVNEDQPLSAAINIHKAVVTISGSEEAADAPFADGDSYEKEEDAE